MKEFTESSTVLNRFLPYSDKGLASCPVDLHVYTLSICCVTVVLARTLQAKGGFYPVKSFVDNDSSSSPLWSKIILFNYNRTV